MSKAFNYTGNELENQSYYSVEFNSFLTIAYYADNTWFIPGNLPVNENSIKGELIVIQKICEQKDIAKPFA